MPRIPLIDPDHANEEVKHAVSEHLAQGYRITNEKRTLLHNVTAFHALEVESYAVDRELQRLVGKRAADFFEYAISLQNDCVVCSAYFGKLLRQNGITDFVSKDESGEFRMDATWLEGLYAEAGEQVTYIKDFLMQYEWWRLVPCFDKSYFYERGSCQYSVCHIGNELYLGYFYGSKGNDKLGKLTAMKNGEYELRWLNCRTGEYSDAFTVNVTDGTYTLPAKPDAGDWAVSVRFIP